ncbi:hypothetical protein F01_420939 [Burkholderia cenocepacia]|nr:hypothetical protein F01_420939 [Burkholderia cenocepacia]
MHGTPCIQSVDASCQIAAANGRALLTTQCYSRPACPDGRLHPDTSRAGTLAPPRQFLAAP